MISGKAAGRLDRDVKSRGAHRACVLLGIVATCRALGVPAQAYLTWAFERLGTHRNVFALPLDAMTPAAFKKTTC